MHVGHKMSHMWIHDEHLYGYKYGYVEQNLDIYFCYLSMATTRMRGSSFFPQGWHLLVGICLFRHLWAAVPLKNWTSLPGQFGIRLLLQVETANLQYISHWFLDLGEQEWERVHRQILVHLGTHSFSLNMEPIRIERLKTAGGEISWGLPTSSTSKVGSSDQTWIQTSEGIEHHSFIASSNTPTPFHFYIKVKEKKRDFGKSICWPHSSM